MAAAALALATAEAEADAGTVGSETVVGVDGTEGVGTLAGSVGILAEAAAAMAVPGAAR